MEQWKRLLPEGLAVQQTASKGKGLFTSGKEFKAGDTILEAPPIALIVSKEEREEYCHYCLKEKDAGLMRCTQCKFIYYCSRRCQKQDWLLHKQECAGIGRISPNVPTDSMRLLLRCLLVYYDRMKSKKFISAPETDGGAKWEFDLLCSYMDDSKLESSSYMVKGVHLLLGEPSDFGFSFAMDVFHKISCNTFTVHNPELKSIGAAVYFIPSLLNHSCWPNCTVCYNSRRLNIRMLEDVADDQELLISYVDLLETRQARREALMHPYGFKCLCTRCCDDSQDSIDTLMESYACTNCSYPVPSSHNMGSTYEDCSTHGVGDITVAEEAVQLAHHHLQELATCRKQQNWELMKRLSNESLIKQKELLYKLNTATVKTLEYLMDACIAFFETQCWEDAVDCGETLTEAYNKCLPTHYPVKGLHLMKVGKMQLLINGQTRKAIEKLYQEDKPSFLTRKRIHGFVVFSHCAIVNTITSDKSHNDDRINAKKHLIISHGSAHPLIASVDGLIAEGRLTLEPSLHVE